MVWKYSCEWSHGFDGEVGLRNDSSSCRLLLVARQRHNLSGGFGLYSYNWTLDAYSGLTADGMGGAFNTSGNVSDVTNGIVPVTKFDGMGTMYAAPWNHQSGLVMTSTPCPMLPHSQLLTHITDRVWATQYAVPVPRVMQWNLSMQRMITQNSVLELAYVASHGYNLSFLGDLNQVPESQLSSNDAQFSAYPNFQSISGSSNNAISNYNSLQTQYTKRMSNGLSLSASYVWSHFLDIRTRGDQAALQVRVHSRMDSSPRPNMAPQTLTRVMRSKPMVNMSCPLARESDS